jgi:hypothetical protein
MLSFFMLQPSHLPWQLTPTKRGCQLSLHHATGVIVEYFSTVSAALRRAQQLNDLVSTPPRRLSLRRAPKASRRRR